MTVTPFEFRQCVILLKAAGRKARNLRQLREGIEKVSDASIVHHTYQYFLKGHIQEYTNDFAQWAGESLEERALAEWLSNIDPYEYRETGELRKVLLRVIDDYLQEFPEPREAIPVNDFYFNEAVTLLFPAGIRAANLAEFLMALRYVDGASIYYHFYDARMRPDMGIDDFSQWFGQVLGNKELAERVRSVDPFMHNLEGIRSRLAQAVEEALKKEMETIL